MPETAPAPAPLAWQVLGTGRWGGIVAGALERTGHRCAVSGGTRIARGDTPVTLGGTGAARGGIGAAYGDRWADSLGRARADGAADAVWIATPPGEHTPLLVRAALEAGCHVVVEKPWLVEAAATRDLMALATRRGLRVAVHHQYLFLDAVAPLRALWHDRADTRFDATFETMAEDRLGLAADANMGTHLLSLRLHLAPRSHLASFVTGYGRAANRRCIALCCGATGERAALDFTASREPIVERFVAAFERAVADGQPPVPDLAHAGAVRDHLMAIRAAADPARATLVPPQG